MSPQARVILMWVLAFLLFALGAVAWHQGRGLEACEHVLWGLVAVMSAGRLPTWGASAGRSQDRS